MTVLSLALAHAEFSTATQLSLCRKTDRMSPVGVEHYSCLRHALRQLQVQGRARGGHRGGFHCHYEPLAPHRFRITLHHHLHGFVENIPKTRRARLDLQLARLYLRLL